MPDVWFNSANGDGVAISTDGLNWYRIADLFDTGGVCRTHTIDLDAAALLDPETDEVIRCLADVSGDGQNNGTDIQPYVDQALQAP